MDHKVAVEGGKGDNQHVEDEHGLCNESAKSAPRGFALLLILNFLRIPPLLTPDEVELAHGAADQKRGNHERRPDLEKLEERPAAGPCAYGV